MSPSPCIPNSSLVTRGEVVHPILALIILSYLFRDHCLLPAFQPDERWSDHLSEHFSTLPF